MDKNNAKIRLKAVKKNSFKYPSYFNSAMKYKCSKLIDELVDAKMLSVLDLDLLFDYVSNLFILEEINKKLISSEVSASELTKLINKKEKISSLLIKEGDRLGLNNKSRCSSKFEAISERTDDSLSLDEILKVMEEDNENIR